MKGLKPTFIAMLAIGLLAGSAVGVAAQDEDPMAPALVTGISPDAIGSDRIAGTMSPVDGGVLQTGVGYDSRWETSDPRLSGKATFRGNWQHHPAAGFLVATGNRVVVNDDGRWVGTASAFQGDGLHVDSSLLKGEGAYAGLNAYVVIDFIAVPPTLDGAIFPDELPRFPEVPAE